MGDVPACHEFLTACGLTPQGYTPESGGYFLSLDGTGLEIRRRDDPSLPPALKTGNMLRLQVPGVVDRAALEAVAAEPDRDRPVLRLAGSRMMKQGFESFWGPGRHKFGSNWFWHFKPPLGCNVEFDADMDTHDDDWPPREAPMGPEASQAFLLQWREKWSPAGGPPPQATMRLAHLEDLPDGGARGFEVPVLRYKVIVVRRGDRVFCWRDLCPHYADGVEA